jgi:outer membrane protein assembly factor BamB
VLGETKELVLAYDTDCTRGVGPTTRASLIAFDRETGDERWRRGISLAGQFVGVRDTIVVVDREGLLQGLSPTTGDVRWEQPTDGRVPEVGNRETVVLTSQPEFLDPEARNPPDQVRAIDRATGEAEWSYRREDLGPLARIETAMVGSDTAIVTFETDARGSGVTVALDVGTGTELWQAPAERNIGAESGWGLLLGQSADGALVGYDRRTRQELWANSVATGLDEVLGKLVLAHAGPETWLALDGDTGTELWAAPQPGSAVAFGQGLLVAYGQDGTSRGRVTALNAGTGDIQWRRRAPYGGAKGWLAARNVYVSGGCLNAEPM